MQPRSLCRTGEQYRDGEPAGELNALPSLQDRPLQAAAVQACCKSQLVKTMSRQAAAGMHFTAQPFR